MSENKIILQIELLLDESGKVYDAIPVNKGEHVTIDQHAVKSSSHTLVKKNEGEILVKKIRDQMWERNITVLAVSKKVDIAPNTFRKYMKSPGAAPLGVMMKICRAVGIQQITLMTNGYYR